MSRRTAAVVTLLGLALLAACDGQGKAAPIPPDKSIEWTASTQVRRPHFEGRMPILVQPGREMYGAGECPDTFAACDDPGEQLYAVLGPARQATLLEARMDVARGGTTWTATLRFTGSSATGLDRARDRATRSDALVLLMDAERRVLAELIVTDLERGTVRLTDLGKPQAWDLVETVERA